MHVLVIGAHGQIGRLLLPRLVSAGHTVRAMIRDPAQADALTQQGVTPVHGDLEGEWKSAFDDVDAVVFSAGSGGSTDARKTLLIDLWGAVETIRYCNEHGPTRYIMISSRLAGNPDNGPETIKHYLVAKHFADLELMRSSLDWTILRPGRLTDDKGSGHIRTTRPAAEEQLITRADVADTIVAALNTTSTSGSVIELYAGESPIQQALENL